MAGGVQVEALAALAAGAKRYDSSEWDDRPGKLVLVYDRSACGPSFAATSRPTDRDRTAFRRFLIASGCQPPIAT